jgi:hypothetical protein
MSGPTDRLNTAESLQAEYERLFPTGSKATEEDSYSLAQPYMWRSVPSFASDNTESKVPY